MRDNRDNSNTLYTNMREQIPDPIYRAMEKAGIGGVFEAYPRKRELNGFHGMYSITLCSREFYMPSPADREAARKLKAQNKPMIFIDHWLGDTLLLLHEFGHHISRERMLALPGRAIPALLSRALKDPSGSEWKRWERVLKRRRRKEAADMMKLKQAARASFNNSDYLSKDLDEITAESIGRLLGGMPLPARLKRLARRVIRESGVRVSIPLFKMKVWKPRPCTFVPDASIPGLAKALGKEHHA